MNVFKWHAKGLQVHVKLSWLLILLLEMKWDEQQINLQTFAWCDFPWDDDFQAALDIQLFLYEILRKFQP